MYECVSNKVSLDINHVSTRFLSTAQWSVNDKWTLLKLIQALVREELIPFVFNKGDLIFYSALDDLAMTVSQVKFTQQNRCLDFSEIYFIHHGDLKRVASLTEFLTGLYPFITHLVSDKLWMRLLNELSDHKRNSLMSEDMGRKKSLNIYLQARHNSYTDVVSWVMNEPTIVDKSLFMEQFVSQGHPMHPCSKTKLGFSRDDVQAYSPEYNPVVRVSIAAIHKTVVGLSVSTSLNNKGYTDWFSSVFPAEYQAWKKALSESSLSSKDYLPLPVHPWQEREIIGSKFHSYISKQLLCFFDQVYIQASPTLSFRTLKPLGNSAAPYMKLPVAIQATSALRTLSPASIKNAALVTDILRDIFIKENNFDQRLKMLPEVAGVYLNDTTSRAADHLGVIFRESVDNELESDENCLVVACLFERSPITHVPLLSEQMTLSGVKNSNDAMTYFKRYASKVIVSYLTLYLRYGIALEGHQQNTLAVFKAGSIQYFIAKDFDGIDIDESVCDKNVLQGKPSLRKVISASAEMPRNNLLHTVYQSHIGEIIIILAEHFDCAETEFWECVANITHDCFMELKSVIDPIHWQSEYTAIMQQNWSCRALLRMRLVEHYDRDGIFTALKNPLANYTSFDNYVDK